jgi:hypothetical protein
MLDNWKTLGMQFADRRFSSSCWICAITGSIQSEEFSYEIMAKDIYDIAKLIIKQY